MRAAHGEHRSARPAMRGALAALVCALAVLLPTSPAHAHASLVGTDPAEGEVLAEAPEAIVLSFDEPVRVSDGAVRLFDATGTEQDVSAAARDADVVAEPGAGLADGTYVVTWRVVSTDGHPISGALTFSVGAPSETVVAPPSSATGTSPSVQVALGVAQGVQYVGLLLACGLVAFLALILPAHAATGLARRRLARAAVLLGGLGVLGGLATLPLSAAYQQGGGLGTVFTAAAWQALPGSGTLLPQGLTTVALVGSLALMVRARAAVPPRVVLVGLLLALVGLVLVGHTRAYGPIPLVMVADLVHLSAGAAWLGGLVGLAISLPGLLGRERLAAEVLGRFSLVAGGLLAAVAFTGSFLGWRILGSWSALVDTRYGVLLLVKVGLVAAVVAVAAWNRYRLLPAVRRATGHDARKAAGRRLRQTVRTEAGGLVLAVLLTGFLVNQTPTGTTAAARGAAPEQAPAISAATVAQLTVVTHTAPRTIGPNTITVQVQDETGEPLEPFATPVVTLSGPEVDLGRQQLRSIASGTYQLEAVIPRAGTWEVRVSVRLDAFENPVLVVPVEISGPAG